MNDITLGCVFCNNLFSSTQGRMPCAYAPPTTHLFLVQIEMVQSIAATVRFWGEEKEAGETSLSVTFKYLDRIIT
jgi:hypothetical protein